jgi:hypothetical protein
LPAGIDSLRRSGSSLLPSSTTMVIEPMSCGTPGQDHSKKPMCPTPASVAAKRAPRA